ncbi:MAG: LysR family transcriptional regulator [Myxococcota bacterium]
MKASLPSLDSIQCFLAAAQQLNFRAAARTVSLTPAALGKRIQQLEEQLGTRLFHRTTRKVELTEAGLALLPYAQRLMMSADSCVKAGRGELGPASMDLVVGTRHELGLSWLVPMLPSLHEEHPHLTLHLYFSSGPDLELRVRTFDIDCAITSRTIEDPRVDELRLHREDYVFVGQPEMLARNPLKHPDDAIHHILVDAHATLPLFRYWKDAPNGGTRLKFDSILRMGTIAAIRALILAGQGVAVLPQYLVQPDLDAGRMELIFPEVELVHDYFRLIFRRDDPRRSAYQRLAETMINEPLK